jgi:hypothetical protein
MNPSIHAKHMECDYFPFPFKFEMVDVGNRILLPNLQMKKYSI